MDKKKKLDENQREELESRIKKQIENHNKLLKGILVAIGILVIVFFAVVFFINSTKSFNYKGVEFVKEEYCDAGPCLELYKTSIPVVYQDSATGNAVNADYNIWLRNNPEELESVPVKGNITFRKNMVIDVNTDDLFCEGDWNIALGNLQKLEVFGMKFIAKNESEIKVYLPAKDYMYVNIMKGNETSIEQVNDNTYNMNVANCEILKATERLMLEAFVQAHSKG